MTLNLKTLGSPPKLAQRTRKRAPSGFRAFSLRASLAGYVSGTAVTGWKSCRVAVPSLGPGAFGLQAAPFSKLSESPLAFKKTKQVRLRRRSLRPVPKYRRRERWKTACLFTRVVTRTKGTVQRRDFAAILSGQRKVKLTSALFIPVRPPIHHSLQQLPQQHL